jgi:hypothetical protein
VRPHPYYVRAEYSTLASECQFAKAKALRAIWRAKVHVEPRALELSPHAVRASYAHIWEPADSVLRELERFPLGLLSTWQSSSRGHLVFTHRRSCYQPGPQDWRDETLESVCYISLTDWHSKRPTALVAVLRLFDHLLGNDAIEGEPWLSDGAGISAKLREVGRRFQEVYALGYARQQLAAQTPHDYLALTWQLYLDEPQRLNVLDPLVFKLYRHTIMDDAFW